MGLFSIVSNKVHQRRLKQAQKEAMRNRKLVLKYQALQDRQDELEKVRKGSLSDKGLVLLAKIKAEKARIRAMRIVQAKKVARIAGSVVVSIAKDISELGGRLGGRKPKARRRHKKKRKTAKKRRSRR